MRLLFSSDALPGGTIHGVDEACRRGAFDGLELSLSHARVAVATDLARAPVRWVRMPPASNMLTVAGAAALAGSVEVAVSLGAGLLVYTTLAAPPPCIALVHGTDRLAAWQAGAWARYHGVGTAWEIDLATLRAETAATVLEHTGTTLAHVRLLGTDADHAACEALGCLLAALALRGYTGTVTRAPARAANAKPEAVPVACGPAEAPSFASSVPILL